MKTGIIILTTLFCGLILNAQTDSIKGKEYILKGKLVNGFDGLTPLCGILAWATVVEFEIIEFSDSEYSKKLIPVIFTCPNSSFTNKFMEGKTYELILKENYSNESDWTMLDSKKEILDKYELKKKYWYIKNK
jgi:hypothetical protein